MAQSALTDRYFEVGPVFYDNKGAHACHPCEGTKTRLPGILATKARRYVFSSTRRFKLARKNDELYRVAARKHEDLSNISTCLNTLTPMWRGKEEHLIELHGKADVK